MPSRGGLNEARLRMARVPEGAELIENRMSGAPGIRVGNIFILAGVPHIAAHDARGAVRHARGRPAAAVADARLLGRRKARSPSCCARPSSAHAGCQIGSYPFFREGRVGANFVIRSTDEAGAGGVPGGSRRAAGGGRIERSSPKASSRCAIGRDGLVIGWNTCRRAGALTRSGRPMDRLFTWFASRISRWSGQPLAFVVALRRSSVWGATGPGLRFLRHLAAGHQHRRRPSSPS